MRTCALFLLGAWMCFVACTSEQNSKVNINVVRADSLLNQVLALYEVKEYGLLLENYTPKENERATYLADETQQKTNQRVSYLWPYSGMVSGCVSLYKTTGDEKYKQLLENRILPGLEKYWDGKREPYCYQSYPMQFGYSDRYYDDNDWLAIDLCDYYALTKDPAVLERAKELHRYIYSGWDEVLGGGIYWCEQKKLSKNTCSNAPATVLCMKLYNLTSDPDYLDLAKKTYRWTKENLCDPSDGVYWDNINLEGNIAKQKYTYNSGQMIQAGVLLFQATNFRHILPPPLQHCHHLPRPLRTFLLLHIIITISQQFHTLRRNGQAIQIPTNHIQHLLQHHLIPRHLISIQQCYKQCRI